MWCGGGGGNGDCVVVVVMMVMMTMMWWCWSITPPVTLYLHMVKAGKILFTTCGLSGTWNSQW